MFKFFQEFSLRFTRQKSFYIVVGLFLVTASFATYVIWANADSWIKPKYSDLLPESSASVEYDENGQPIASTANGQKKSKNSSSSSSTANSSSQSSSSGGDTPEEDTFSVAVAFYADSQSDTDEEDGYHANDVSHILASGANPVFHAGDLMEDGTPESLARFNNVTATLRSSRTFYAAPGNNDRTVGDSSTISPFWFTNFSFPGNGQWYSVNFGNLHMVILDSAFSSGSASQLAWLASDLQSAASQDRITGVMYHHPTFVSTINQYLINYGADFVVAGHIHSYSHTVSNGINFYTMSGQPSIGYMKASIYQHHVTTTDYNNAGGVVETVTFNER